MPLLQWRCLLILGHSILISLCSNHFIDYCIKFTDISLSIESSILIKGRAEHLLLSNLWLSA